MISICTLFDSRYSIEGWLLWKSINKFDKYMKFYVLCMDERVFEEAQYLKTKSGDIFPIRLYDFENHFPELLNTRKTRPWPPYTQTCKVFLPTYIFDYFNEEKLCYVDRDLYFWGNPNEIEKEMKNYSFMVSSREQDPPPAQGRYNGGFFSCRNDDNCKKFLKWWQKKCIEWCLWEPGKNGRFTEEGYLNIFYEEPEKFENIYISSNPGINLANWNIEKHNLKIIDNEIMVDKNKLICFHYQGFKIRNNKYEAHIVFRNNVIRYIYDKYYEDYIFFKKEFLNELDKFWW